MSNKVLTDLDAGRLRDLGALEEKLVSHLSRIRNERRRIYESKVKPIERPISDHGILRYLERIEHLDVEGAKARFRQWFESCEPSAMRGVFIHDTTKEQVVTNRSGVIVTVLPAGHAVGYESSDFDKETTDAD